MISEIFSMWIFLSYEEGYISIFAKICKMQMILPGYWFFSSSYEVFVGLREGPRTEKSSVSRERTRMRRSENQVFRTVDEGFLRDRIGSPEDEYDSFPSLRYCSDSSIGEVFPSFSLVRCWFSLAYS